MSSGDAYVEPSFPRVLNQRELEQNLSAANITNERWITNKLRNYCDTQDNKMFGVYGLRRTGKSVMLWTAALELINQGRKVTFWELDVNVTANTVLTAINNFSAEPGDVLFIDEATFAENFSAWGLVLYNKFAARGVRVIVSGTYSYALKAASSHDLYGRLKLMATTAISFAEYNHLTGKDLETFLTSGGVLDPMTEDWTEYLDTSVVMNLVKSMKRLNAPKYSALANIREETVRSYLLHILQEVYLRPILEELSSEYEYPELEQSLNNLIGRGSAFPDIEIHKTKIGIHNMLKLEDIPADNTKTMMILLRDVLTEMDLLDSIETVTVTEDEILRTREYFITQSGLMYYLALVSKDSALLNITDNTELLENLENVVRGKILENIVFRDLKLLYPEYKLLQLRGPKFEIDAIMRNEKSELRIYEIKHSSKAKNALTKNLNDTRLADFLGTVFGSYNILDKAILYMGNDTNSENNTKFLNAEHFLLKNDLKSRH